MFAQPRRRQGASRPGQGHRAHQGGVAAHAGVLHLQKDPSHQPRIAEEVGKGVHGACGHPRPLELLDPKGTGPLQQDLLQEGEEELAVLDPGGVGGEAGVVGELRPAQDGAQGAELGVRPHGHHEQAICSGEGLVGHDLGVGGAQAFRLLFREEEGLGHVHQGRGGVLDEGGLHGHSLPGFFPQEEGAQDPAQAGPGGEDVHDGHAHLGGPRVLAGDGHEPAQGLDEGVKAGLLPVRAGREAQDGQVDRAGVEPAHGLVGDPELFRRGGQEVVHDHVALFHEFSQDLLARRGGEVQGDPVLPAVDGQEVGGFPGHEGRAPAAGLVAPVGPLHLDHLRAEVGQPHRAQRPGQDPRKIQNPDPFQRLHRSRTFLSRSDGYI